MRDQQLLWNNAKTIALVFTDFGNSQMTKSDLCEWFDWAQNEANGFFRLIPDDTLFIPHCGQAQLLTREGMRFSVHIVGLSHSIDALQLRSIFEEIEQNTLIDNTAVF